VSEPVLEWLALARGTLDRVSDRRRDEAWVAARWAEPATRVLVVERGKVLVSAEPALVLTSPQEAPKGERFFLGLDEDGVAYFSVAAPLPVTEGAAATDLRRIGAALSNRDSTLLTQAIALDNWHGTHTHCPRCGARTEPAAAGHVRVCAADGSQHFPRVDPAVIMAVLDEHDRILLGRAPMWPERMMSVLAGFVEPGESLEQAVAREVREEVGLVVEQIGYLGSQPWPMPRSLMVGFVCRAAGGQAVRLDPEEIAEARWFTREELRAATESEETMLPGRVSIARQLIERWYGGPLSGEWRRS
jgi:NAD+ diphosphatase